MSTYPMRLKVLLPTGILFDGVVTKIIAEAENGSFCILPRHADFVAALVPGILCFYTADSTHYGNHESFEHFSAIDSGSLIKCGKQVSISTFNAVNTMDLELLRSTVAEQFYELSEREKAASTALNRLEALTLRRFLELDTMNHG